LALTDTAKNEFSPDEPSSTSEKVGTEPPKPRLSPFQRILLALLLGVTTGVFLGELAAPLRVVGDVYVGFLQMTVLPFIICSVIGNIGRLTVDQSKQLAINSFAVLIILWGIGALAVVLIAQTLPQVPAGSFFSTSQVETSRD